MVGYYLFLSASVACIALSIVVLAGPNDLIKAASPGAYAAQCSRLIESYEDQMSLPARGTPAFRRYADCYYEVCGIRP